MSQGINNFAVKIETEETWGSGVLYVPRQHGNFAYILTVCHIFKKTDKEFKISISYSINLNENEKKIDYHCRFVKPGTPRERYMGVCRVCTLPGYRFDDEGSPNDGAVVEVQYEPWMKDIEFSIEKAEADERLEGWGYPKTVKGRDKFNCNIVTVAENKLGRNSDVKDTILDYIASFDVDKYKEYDSINSEFLDGWSGTGLFRKDKDTVCLSALLSRDAGSNPRIYLTDAVRLQEMVSSMIILRPKVFPTVSYIPFENLDGRDPDVDKNKPMDFVLNKVIENRFDYFRIIYGDMWCGKSYAVIKWSENHPDKICLKWDEILDCFNNEIFYDYENRIFVIDGLEREFTKEEKSKLYAEQDSSNVQKGHLTTLEKKLLIEIIENYENECSDHKITVLLICRSNFFKDAIESMKEDYTRIEIRKKVIVCNNIDSRILEKLMKFYEDFELPDYFFDIPFVKRHLQWLVFFEQHTDMLPKPGELQYEYEFRLYRKIASNIDKNNLFVDNHTIFFRRIRKTPVKQYLSKYLITFLGRGYNPCIEWEECDNVVFEIYPFIKEEGSLGKKEFKMTDDVLYSYLLAEELYNLLDVSSEKFQNFVKVVHYHFTFSEDKDIENMGYRIVIFFHFLCEKKPEVQQKAFNFLSDKNSKECREWLLEKDENELRSYRKNITLCRSMDFNSIVTDLNLGMEAESLSYIVNPSEIKYDEKIDLLIRLVRELLHYHKENGNEEIKTLKI